MFNINLQLFLSNDLRQAKFKDLADMYNTFATQLDLKTIKKFKDKATGIKRIVEIQATYLIKVSEFKAEFEAEHKPDLELEAAEDADFNTRIEQAADKAANSPILYKVATVKPKSESSAMGIIYKFVEEGGIVNLEELCEHFLSEYSLQYKGKAELNTSFAKGYIKGAVRASNIRTI